MVCQPSGRGQQIRPVVPSDQDLFQNGLRRGCQPAIATDWQCLWELCYNDGRILASQFSHAWTLKVGLQMFQQSHSNGQETWHIRIILRLKRMPSNQSIRLDRFKKFQEVGVSNKLKDGRFFGGSSKDDRSGSMSGARIVLKSCDNVFAFHQTWNRRKPTGTHAPRYQDSIARRGKYPITILGEMNKAWSLKDGWSPGRMMPSRSQASERVICATKQTISKRKG